jgi:hypothetical protein
VLAVLAATLLVGLAPQSGIHARLSSPPSRLIAGRAWRATLVVRPALPSAPTVLARRGSTRALTFRTRKTGPGRYRVRLVLPGAGRWLLKARVGRRVLPLRGVTVRPLPPLSSPLLGATAFRV